MNLTSELTHQMNSTTLSDQDRKAADKAIDYMNKWACRYFDAVGVDHITITFERNKPTPPAPPRITVPSHLPTRLPKSPGPGDVRLDRLPTIDTSRVPSLEKAARDWSEKNGFNPPLHATDLDSVDWFLDHHAECGECSWPRRKCDCGFLLRCRYAGSIFAVAHDGSLEPYTEPAPKPADYRRDEMEFYRNQTLTPDEYIRAAVRPIIMGHTEIAYSTVGEGDDERFIEMPRQPRIQSRLNQPKDEQP